jgi:hypothetical protein
LQNLIRSVLRQIRAREKFGHAFWMGLQNLIRSVVRPVSCLTLVSIFIAVLHVYHTTYPYTCNKTAAKHQTHHDVDKREHLFNQTITMATPKTTTTLLLDAMDDTDVIFVTKLAANAKNNEELDVKDGRGMRAFMAAARGLPSITTGTNTKGTTQQKCKLEIGHSKAQTMRCIRHISPCVIVVLVTMAGLSVHGFSTSSSPVARTSLSPLLPSPLFRQPAHHQHLVNMQQQPKFQLAVSKAHLPCKPSQDLSEWNLRTVLWF